ncbi:hypothetical protein [Niallia sp. FSL R7-0271]|uniref:hypothetical protein n=1 Tax=Niallia sp. FSL R7-0271 TaxID=2921678 RepID=UPI0030F4B7DE
MNAVASTSNFKHYEELTFEAYRKRKGDQSNRLFHYEANDETFSGLITEQQQILKLTIKKQQLTQKEILIDVLNSMHAPTDDMQT